MPLIIQESSVCRSCVIWNYSLHLPKSPDCRLLLSCIVLCILLLPASSNLLPINDLPIRTRYVMRFMYVPRMLICVSAGAAYIVLSPEYSKPTHRGARTKVFIALGLSAVIPITHALKIYGSHTLRTEFGFDWVILSGALYIGGALL